MVMDCRTTQDTTPRVSLDSSFFHCGPQPNTFVDVTERIPGIVTTGNAEKPLPQPQPGEGQLRIDLPAA